MNSVHLIGRLATDVDVKEVNGGSKVSQLHPGGGPQRGRGGLRNSATVSLLQHARATPLFAAES